MTRLLQSGWETGDANQIGAAVGVGSLGAPTVVSATPTARSGTYCLKCSSAASGTATLFSSRSICMIAHASKTELYYAFAFYRNDSETFTAPSRMFFYTLDSAGSVGIGVTAEPDGNVRAYVATAGTSNPSPGNFTLIGTSGTTIPANTWVLIEIHIIAATGSTGTFEMKINGASVISATSQRTSQTNANMTAFALSFIRIQNPSSGSSSTYVAFDDLRVNDTAGSVNNTWCGDESIIMLKPNAAGDSTQFSRGGADSGANYGQVDEAPPNALTDYVYDTVTGHMDLYNLPTVTVVSVSAVEVIAQAFNVDGAGGSMNFVTKTAAGQSDGTAQSISGTPAFYKRLLETDPADSAAWDQTKINALQVGVKVAS
jgi:hypothetical protein